MRAREARHPRRDGTEALLDLCGYGIDAAHLDGLGLGIERACDFHFLSGVGLGEFLVSQMIPVALGFEDKSAAPILDAVQSAVRGRLSDPSHLEHFRVRLVIGMHFHGALGVSDFAYENFIIRTGY